MVRWGKFQKQNNKQNIFEKVNRKNKKLGKIFKGACSICGRNKSHSFTKLMTKGEDFIERGKCKKKYCSSMS